MSKIVSQGNLNQIIIRMITNPPASLSWCTALPPRRHLRYCSSPPLHSQALHHQPPHCPPLRKAHKLWWLVRLGCWWTVTHLSDTALSLEIHLVVDSLQESQLRKNCSSLFCRVWVLPNLDENLPRGGQAGPGPLCPADSFGQASWFRKTQSMPLIQHKSPLLLILHETKRLCCPSILRA